MRVNSRVFEERTDMFHHIQVPNCPSEFRKVAENILMMATKPGYSVGDYNTMTELDKNLMVDYWYEFDDMKFILIIDMPDRWREWFVKHATAPELIRRARQFLVERNWIIVKPEIQKRAFEAADKFRKSIKQG